MKPRLMSSTVLLVSSFFMFQPTEAPAQKAESKDKPLSLSIGTVRTELEAAAVRYLVEYTQNLHDIFVDGAADADGSWLLALTPNIRIETGEKDAFNGVMANLSGNFILFSETTVDGIRTPNTADIFHVIPISVEAETNGGFNNVNGLVEVGYVPWYQNRESLSGILRKTKIGIFVQGGYKFKVDTSAANSTTIANGAVDQSKEDQNSGLFRLKGSLGFSPKIMFSEEFGLSVIGNADGWWDIANSTTYFAVNATFRVILSSDKYFDFSYQKGSGAPNFNKGDQFSANITVMF
ncbi:MAG: hypothetical protein Q8P51_08905 [Ignavibacteria bacterium]|nr:hypothetical protein [Ignavibacteria bacterium]